MQRVWIWYTLSNKTTTIAYSFGLRVGIIAYKVHNVTCAIETRPFFWMHTMPWHAAEQKTCHEVPQKETHRSLCWLIKRNWFVVTHQRRYDATASSGNIWEFYIQLSIDTWYMTQEVSIPARRIQLTNVAKTSWLLSQKHHPGPTRRSVNWRSLNWQIVSDICNIFSKALKWT